MDIQVSSNFDRLLFDAYDRDADAVRGLMDSLTQSRRFEIAPSALARIGALFTAGTTSEGETAATNRTTLQEAG
jgi:threonine synthase